MKNSVLWEVETEYFTMRLFHFGKTECCSHWRWTEEYWMIWDMFWPLSSSESPLKGPWCPLIVHNRRPSVPWEFELTYFTMGWFQYGKTGCYSQEKQRKDFFMIWGMFWPFSGSEGAQKGPREYKMVHNRWPSVPWEIRTKYFAVGWFHQGKTWCYSQRRWEKKYLLILGMF